MVPLVLTHGQIEGFPKRTCCKLGLGCYPSICWVCLQSSSNDFDRDTLIGWENKSKPLPVEGIDCPTILQPAAMHNLYLERAPTGVITPSFGIEMCGTHQPKMEPAEGANSIPRRTPQSGWKSCPTSPRMTKTCCTTQSGSLKSITTLGLGDCLSPTHIVSCSHREIYPDSF